MLLFLFKETKKQKYIKTADLLYNQFIKKPRTSEGGFVLRHRLFIDLPFYAEYAKLFNRPDRYDDVVLQFVLSGNQALDADRGGSDSRGENPAHLHTDTLYRFRGGYAMALVDGLKFIPEDHSPT